MKLQDAGKLKVSAKACKYLVNCPASWKSITIHQLLGHRSGIPDLTELLAYAMGTNYTPRQLIAMAQRAPLNFKPGMSFSYSNTNYVALVQIVERVSGEPYPRFLQEKILRPLGLNNTGLARLGVALPAMAQPYVDQTPASRDVINPTNYVGAANMYSTTGDLYRWDTALLGGRVVSNRSLRAMTTRWTPHPPKDWPSFGYGLVPDNYKGHTIINTAGGLPGITTFNFVFPKDHVSVILLCNSDQTTARGIFSKALSLMFG